MWHDVGAPSDVAEEEPLAVKVEGQEIGIYRIGDTLHAIEDICPHAYALLSQGFVEGEEVECPLHGALFHIPSGKCLAEPADRDLKTFPAREENGRIMIEL